MEDLIIFRIFMAFPLIGLLIPDLGGLLSNTKSEVTATHLIIEITLLISILTLTAGIMYFKRKQNPPAVRNNGISVLKTDLS
jgi:hypothetical protein